MSNRAHSPEYQGGRPNTSGYRGVGWSKVNSRWFARTKRGSRYYYFGSFVSKEDAINAYKDGVAELERFKQRLDASLLPGTARPIPGYDGYFADDFANIWSTKRTRPFILSVNSSYDYFVVAVTNNEGIEQTKSVHRLVAKAFHGMPVPPRDVCRHLDGNPQNNLPANLEWGTEAENNEDKKRHGRAHGNRKLTPDQAREIRSLKGSVSRNELAARFNVLPVTVGDVMSGKTWKYLDKALCVDEALANASRYKERSECAKELRALADQIDAGNSSEKCWVVINVLSLPASYLDKVLLNAGHEHERQLLEALMPELPNVTRVPRKLSENHVKEILQRRGTDSLSKLALEYGVSKSNIAAILKGKIWSRVTGIGISK